MFTSENTEGYTITELAALNVELSAILSEIPEEKTEERAAAE
jgi:hypothetical protein